MHFLVTFGVIMGLSWTIDRLPFVQKLWAKFTAATDKAPFFAGANPELRLCGITFFIGLGGAITAIICDAASGHFPLLEIGTFAGGILVVFSVAIGFYTVSVGWLSFFGLRKSPRIGRRREDNGQPQ